MSKFWREKTKGYVIGQEDFDKLPYDVKDNYEQSLDAISHKVENGEVLPLSAPVEDSEPEPEPTESGECPRPENQNEGLIPETES